MFVELGRPLPVWSAKALLASGVGKSTRVAFHLPNGTEWVTAWAAITRVGGLAIPLSTLAAPSELAAALRHTDAHVLIAPTEMFGRDHEEYLERALPELTRLCVAGAPPPARPGPPDDPHVGHPYVRAGCSFSTGPPPMPSAGSTTSSSAPVEREVVPSDELMVVSTSGSTSEPKAVVHTHGAVFRKTSVPSVIVVPPGGRASSATRSSGSAGSSTWARRCTPALTIVCQERPHTESALRLSSPRTAPPV